MNGYGTYEVFLPPNKETPYYISGPILYPPHPHFPADFEVYPD